MNITLKEIKEIIKKELIIEIRLKRWLDTHFSTTGFASITSDRGDAEKEENDKNFNELMKLIRGAGYGFVKTEGGWEEDQSGKGVHVTERSLMIPNQSSKLENNEETVLGLFDLCKTASDMYNQDAFLFGWGKHHTQSPDDPGEPFAAVYDRSGKVLYGPYTAAQEGDALKVWSRLVKGKDRRIKFAFTEWSAAEPPKNQFEAMGRSSQGEIFLAKPEV
tara:strand:- start:2336 stop:2992 length:657 start_codon:yes stop_codon:yes gene_type:complete